ncbi:MAG: hypothetical protein NWQ13_09410, partial [Glaciimonas sp.]|nr:hypothetical protein [Glaciimonas sp.]
MGAGAHVSGDWGVAAGASAKAANRGDVAIGGGAAATGGNATDGGNAAIALGASSIANGGSTTAIGTGTHATAANATALGTLANASGDSSISIGSRSSATNVGAIAMGGSGTTFGAKATADYAIAFGTDSQANNVNSVALGQNTRAIADNSIALGSGSIANRGNALSIGAVGSERQIINVANGTQATDAANFGQLTATSTSIATALGGGSVVNANGTITAPSYTIQGTTQTTVGGALGALNTAVTTNTTTVNNLTTQLNSGAVGLVRQASATADITVAATQGGAGVDFHATGGATRTLKGVTAGNIASAASTDAVNGGQLFATNTNVTNLTTRVGAAETTINNLQGQIGGIAVGSVMYDDAIAKDKITLGGVGASTPVTLGNVADGAAPSDAVNFGQLTTTNNNVTNLTTRVGATETDITSIHTTLASLGSSLNGAVVYNPDKSMVNLGGINGTIIDNMSNGIISAGSMQAVNGGQIFSMKAAWDKQLQDIVDNADAAIGIVDSKLKDLTGVVADQGKQIGDLDDRVGLIETGIADGSIGGGNGGINDKGNVELGVGTVASGDKSTAVGSGSTASGDKSTAIGDGSTASGKNSVAIGAGSVAAEDNTVSFGSAGNERRLTNVADGVAPTDAVNKRQLDGAIAGVN